MSRLRRISDSHELAEVGISRARDKAFGTVDNVIIALTYGPRLHRGRIRARVWFGLHEAKFFFAAQNGVHKPFFLIIIQRVQDRPNIRSENSLAARRQRNGTGELFPNQDLRQATQPTASILFGHIEHPQPHLFGFLLQALANMRFQLHILERMHLDGNQLFIDKLPHRVFEHLQFFRQIEIHATLRLDSLRSRSPSYTPRRGGEKRGGTDFRLLTSDFYLSITFSLQTYTNQVLGGTLYAQIAAVPAARRSQAWLYQRSTRRFHRRLQDWSRTCSTMLP